jgi:hypothetical protein
MKFHEGQMGFFGWIGDDITIYGGMRADGFHPPGHLWCHFLSYDQKHRQQTGEDKPVGKLKLLVKFHENDPPEIVKLLELNIDDDLRRNPRKKQSGQGYGRRTIAALQEVIKGDIEIKDIKPSAKGFWKKVGVDIVERPRQIDGILHVKAKPALSIDNAAYRYMGDTTSECHLLDPATTDLAALTGNATTIFSSEDDNDRENWLLTKGGQLVRQTGLDFSRTYLVDADFTREMVGDRIDDDLDAQLVSMNVLPPRPTSQHAM